MPQFIVVLALQLLCNLLLLGSVQAREVRLVGGFTRCQGRLDVSVPSGGYARACSTIVDDREAQVICRQLGCNPEGARRSTNPLIYGDSRSITLFGFVCNGEEQMVSECPTRGGLCLAGSSEFNVAIECGGQIDAFNFMLTFAIISGILWIILSISLALLIYYLIKVRKSISSWNFRIFSIFVIIMEIILLLAILIMLIVFGNQQGLFLALYTLIVSVVALAWFVVLVPVVVVICKRLLRKSNDPDRN